MNINEKIDSNSANKKEIKTLSERAIILINKKDYDGAKKLLLLILEVDANNHFANTNLGLINFKLNDIIGGFQYLQIALKINPNSIESWTNYIRHLIYYNKIQEARECILKSYSLGFQQTSIHRLDAMIIKSDNILETEKQLLYRLILENKHQKGLDIALELNKKFPSEPSIIFSIGLLLMKVQRYKEAFTWLDESLKINESILASYEIIIGLIKKEFINGDSRKYEKKYLIQRSKKIKTNANILNVIDIYLNKIEKQKNIPTFFDNVIINNLLGYPIDELDNLEIFEQLEDSKNNRFISHNKRKEKTKGKRQIEGFAFSSSQGTHSLIKWREYELYKTTNDLIIYWMIINELKPEIILELGSGSGGSALWMSDICKALGLSTHIYSYDLNKPSINNENISFIEFNLEKLNSGNELPLLESHKKKNKLIIEDAHVNIIEVLENLDKLTNHGDYLIIEDSETKQDEIEYFLKDKSKKYKVDQFYLDFFGMNMTCSIDSIFRVFN